MKPRAVPDADQPTAIEKPIHPTAATKDLLNKSRGMTRKGFGQLLKRAICTGCL